MSARGELLHVAQVKFIHKTPHTLRKTPAISVCLKGLGMVEKGRKTEGSSSEYISHTIHVWYI